MKIPKVDHNHDVDDDDYPAYLNPSLGVLPDVLLGRSGGPDLDPLAARERCGEGEDLVERVGGGAEVEGVVQEVQVVVPEEPVDDGSRRNVSRVRLSERERAIRSHVDCLIKFSRLVR